MQIKKILSQYRRDFSAVYICEHCNHEYECYGYDDSYFHENVIPEMSCPSCGKKASDEYIPRETKYPDSTVI
jgi:rubrerythrin